MTESMNEAEQTNKAETSQTADDATLLYGEDKSGETQQQASDTQNRQAQDEADTGKDEGKEDKGVLGAPESYTFAENESYKVDEEVLNAFKDTAKELDLSNEAAQKLVDEMAPKIAQRQIEQIHAVQEEWALTSKGDKEFGGEKLTENLSIAKKALDTFGTPELSKLLNESGLGNHPEVIRLMVRAGKAISADSYVGASEGAGNKKDRPMDMASIAEALYGNQQST